MRSASHRAFSAVKPRPVRIAGNPAWNDATVGYFAFVIASSSTSDLPARDENPEYQMSNGSSGRPRRFSMTAARPFTSFEVRTDTSRSSTCFSGICRSSSNLRRMNVGAVGQYGSACRTARYTPKSLS